MKELPTAMAMAGHLEKVVEELNSMEPLLNFFASRSASAPLSLLAGRHQAGVVIPGAGHQVFRRPPALSSKVFDPSDPDARAYHALLDFLKHWTED